MSHRVLLAGLYHETHTFVDDTSGLDAFEKRVDHELLASRGDDSPMSGVIDCAESFGWELVPAVDFRGGASGMVEDVVLEEFWRLLEPRLAQAIHNGIDAIYLVLHGAMTTRSHFDAEGTLLARIRDLPGAGSLPVFGVYDLHANFTQEMAERANCLVAYRNNPHTDARESAVRAAGLLHECLEGRPIPHMFMARPPVVWPPTGTGTADDPMRTLEAMAREMELEPGIWTVNVNGGFSFADVPAAGVSFSVAAADHRLATTVLDRLSAAAWELRELGNVTDTPIDDVLSQVKANAGGPVILVEPSDNIGGGAPGDGTGVLRAFLRHGTENSGVIIDDAEAVARLAEISPGQSTMLSIGGKGSRLDPGPVELEVELVSTSNGRFELEDPHSHLAAMRGRFIDMGPCAIVRHGGITILLTSRKTPPFDLGQWRSQGVNPEELSFIGVKAAVAHRRAYDHIASESYTVATDGPCASDLRRLPFGNIRRPIYPLDSFE